MEVSTELKGKGFESTTSNHLFSENMALKWIQNKYIWKERTVSSINGAGKTGQPHAKE